MTAVAPSDSGSSFSSAPSESSGSHNYSHHSLLALAALHNNNNNNNNVSLAAAAGGGNVTPSKSLTPRYAAIHGPTSGVAQTYLQQQRMLHQRREARPRFVEGGAPAERYLEPLPQHLQLPAQPQVYHQNSQTFGSGLHLRSLSPQANNNRGGGGGFSSPSFRQLPPCPASPTSVMNTTASSSPSTHTIHPPLLSSSYNNNNNNNNNHLTSTNNGGSINSPQATMMMSGNSESCISLRAAATTTANGNGTTIVVHHHSNAPYVGALTLDSVTSRGLVPSPLVANLNPASPCLPRPPSISDRALNPRQRSVGSSNNASISPQRGAPAVSARGVPEFDNGASSSAVADVEEPSLSHVLGNYYAGIQKVDSMVLPRLSSGALMTPSTMLSPPSHPIGGFIRGGGVPHQLAHLPDDMHEDDRSGSTSTGHASPYSSFRLDGSQWEVPSPRVASTTLMDVSGGLRISPQAVYVGTMGISGGGGGGFEASASPTVVPRTPTCGSPRTLIGFPGSYAGSPLAKHHHHQQQQQYMSTFMSQHQLLQQSAAPASAFTSPPEERLFDGRVHFSFQPRDGACTVDSLEDDSISAQQSPR